MPLPFRNRCRVFGVAVGLTLCALFVALYVISAFRSIWWEGPSDWEVALDPGVISFSMTDPGREHFRGPYGRGWQIETAEQGFRWGLDWSVDYGPFSVYVYPLWVPLLAALLLTAFAWRPRLIPRGGIALCTIALMIAILALAAPWLAIAAGVPGVYVWLRLYRQFKRERLAARGACRSCEYDRSGLAPSAPCPECGTVPP